MDPLNILVVDDEPDLQVLLRQKFRKRIRNGEILFHFAGDGVEALQLLENHDGVEIVLTDINMPRMDGLTLLGRISDQERILKVVIVSAYGDLDNIRTAMNRGAFDFLTKPIDFEDLMITVEKTTKEVRALRRAIVLQSKLSTLEKELEIARKIQSSALPTTFPAFPDRSDFDLYAEMLPAQEVSGDFYDFFLIDEHRLGVVLGDVSGKGVGAALLMATTRTMIRATGMQGLPAHETVRHVNRVLYPETVKRMFVTLVYGILDTRTGALTYCNAGHNPPYLQRKSGEVAELPRVGGVGVCLVKDFDFKLGETTLAPGESLLLYSDGVTEAVDAHRNLFEEERLIDCLSQTTNAEPLTVLNGVLEAVTAFVNGTLQADDITMLSLQYKG